MINTLINNAPNPIATFVFAHGAGAGKNSEFMQLMAQRITKHGINVVRFNFAYMQMAEDLGKRRPPDRSDKLLVHFKKVLSEIDDRLPIFIGGKSMGGRMASMLLQESAALGCICMGYPFHPPGKPEKLRTEHLLAINKPVLILQGERDTFGTREDIGTYNLSAKVQIHYLADGDHGFKPRKASGFTLDDHLNLAITHTAEFIKSHI
ncbi:MAG: putative alpha/beta-hydrolase family hydrolase [Flavobacteriales bacterium]|jgi:predicted alpha/beta-hydrolase family hydrolase